MAEQDEGHIVLIPVRRGHIAHDPAGQVFHAGILALLQGDPGPGHPLVDRDAAALHQAIGVEQQRRTAGQDAGRVGPPGLGLHRQRERAALAQQLDPAVRMGQDARGVAGAAVGQLA